MYRFFVSNLFGEKENDATKEKLQPTSNTVFSGRPCPEKPSSGRLSPGKLSQEELGNKPGKA
jgi:hypothetical protein